MRIIDFHTHVYPDAIADKAAQSVRKFYEIPGFSLDGKVSTLLREGTKAGVDKFLILPVSLSPDRTRHINQYILSQLAQESRFVGFGTVHAGQADLMDEVDFITGSGLRGIKMHPDSQQFDIDDPRLLPMYEAVQGKLPVMLHAGDPRYDYSHPARIRNIMRQFPQLQVIAAHFGGYRLYETAYECLREFDNCYFDTSSSLMFMAPGIAEDFINRYGAERFLYGTDYPMWDPAEEWERFFRLRLTDRQKEQIAHKTAEALLDI